MPSAVAIGRKAVSVMTPTAVPYWSGVGRRLDGAHERRVREQPAEGAAAVEAVPREHRASAEPYRRRAGEVGRVARGGDVDVDDDIRPVARDEREPAAQVELLLRRKADNEPNWRRRLEGLLEQGEENGNADAVVERLPGEAAA